MAKAEEWPGFGQRIRQRMRDLGYVRPDGKEDISRFTVEHGYIVTAFYKYLTNTTPSRENLLRLAKDLEVDAAWLLFGTGSSVPAPTRPKTPKRGRGMVPIGGGSDYPDAPAGVSILDTLSDAMSLIGLWLRRRWGWIWPSPQILALSLQGPE